MHPENVADEMNRIARILITEGSEKVEPLADFERQQIHEQLNALLQNHVTYAALVCMTLQTQEFLEAYTDGVPEYANIHDTIASAL